MTDGGEHAQRQHVDFHQPEFVDIVLVPLDDAASGHRGVLDRHQPIQATTADDEAADMLRKMARETTQDVGEDQPFLHAWTVGIEPDGGKTLGQLLTLVPPGQRRGQGVDAVAVDAECPANIAQGRACAVADHGGGQRGALAAVSVVEVLDNLLSPPMLEINVDVGRFVTFFRNETFEQQLRPGRVDLGDAQRVTHRRIGRRATPLAQDAACPGKFHHIVDREKVRLVAQLGDQGEFAFNQRAHFRRNAFGIARGKPRFHLGTQVGAWRLAAGNNLLRIFIAQFVERKATHSGDTHAFRQQLGRIKTRQTQAWTQMTLAVGEECMAGRVDRRFQTQGGQHILQGTAATCVHVHVTRRDQRQARCLRQRSRRRQPAGVVDVQMPLESDPGAVGESLGQPARIVTRLSRSDIARQRP